MATNDPEKIRKAYEKAVKSAEELVGKTKAISEMGDLAKESFDSLTKTFANISGSDFFKEIEKTPQDIASSAQNIKSLKEELKKVSEIVGKDFRNAFSSIYDNFNKIKKETSSIPLNIDTNQFVKKLGASESLINELQVQIEDMKKKDFFKNDSEALEEILKNSEEWSKNLSEIDKKSLTKIVDKFKKINNDNLDLEKAFKGQKHILEDLKSQFDESLIKKMVEYGDEVDKFIEKEGKSAIQMLSIMAKGNEELQSRLAIYQNISGETDKVIKKESEFKKMQMDIFSGLQKGMKNLASSMFEFIKGYDQAVSEAQRNTGIMFKENNDAMMDLTSHNAAFGMSLRDTTEMMGQLGDKLSTTNFSVLSKAAKDFSAIAGAVGATSSEITNIAGEMMLMGSSSEAVKNAFTDANKQAIKLGVNSRKVVQQIEKNITKMREFGFTGGIKSLQKMAVEAERLRIEVDEIFNVAKRARNIEGALEMAAELQLAGGSFSNINPMDLLSAARKGPEELGKILTSMGKDIGRFSKNANGELEFAFDPVDVDRLQIVADSTGMSLDALQKTIKKNAEDSRKQKFFTDSMFDFKGGISEENKKLLYSLTEMDGKGDIKFTSDEKTTKLLKKAGIEISDASKLSAQQVKELERIYNEENRNLEEQNKKNASFNEALDRLKNSFMSVFAVLEPAISWLAEVIGDFAQWIGKMSPEMKKFIGVGLVLAAGLAAFSPVAMMLAGGLGKLVKLPSLLKSSFKGGGSIFGSSGGDMKAAENMKGKPGGFLTSLSEGVKSFGGVSVKDLAKFALAMTIIGGALVGFTIAIAKFGGEATIEQLVTVGASLVLLGSSIFLLSKMKVDVGNILKMSLAMVMISSSLFVFASAANLMTDIPWKNVLASLGLLTLTIIGLTALGTLLMGPQLLALGIGIAALVGISLGILSFSSSLLLAANAFDKIASVDWTSFSSMGSALLSVVPGMIGFSFAAMSFVNPATMLGLVIMTTTLIGLTAVMSPLATSLNMASDGFAKFASNMGLLADAVAKFDVDKFERIAEASSSMAENSVMAGIGNIINGLTGANSSSGSGTKNTVVHEVNLKLNGREIQKLIIDDNQLLS